MSLGQPKPPALSDGEIDEARGAAARPSSSSRLRIVRLAVLALLVGLFFAEYSDLIDRYFIFRPYGDPDGDPADLGLAFDEVRFTTADGVTLHGWFAPGADAGGATLVVLHGHAGNISHYLVRIAEMHRRLGVNVLIFDYRGFGLSDGRPSEKGTYLDAEAALDYLASRGDVAPDRVALFGHSLGAAVAVETALRREVYAVVLEAPFTSIRAMSERDYPWVPGIGRALRTKYDSLSKIGDVETPVMVIHGDGDETIPFEMGREMYDAAAEPKRFLPIAGAGHDDADVVGADAYYEAIAAFLQDPAGRRADP